jgi:hypothetical protein
VETRGRFSVERNFIDVIHELSAHPTALQKAICQKRPATTFGNHTFCSMPAAFSSRFFCNDARRLASSNCFSLALRFAFLPVAKGVRRARQVSKVRVKANLWCLPDVLSPRRAFPFRLHPYRQDLVSPVWFPVGDQSRLQNKRQVKQLKRHGRSAMRVARPGRSRLGSSEAS